MRSIHYQALTKSRRYFAIKYLVMAVAVLVVGTGPANAGPGGGTYYANSPAGIWTSGTGTGLVTHNTGTALRKFVDRLPGLGLPGCAISAIPGTGTCNQNNFSGSIFPFCSGCASYPGSDYYVIGLQDYRARMHSDLP